MAFVLILILTVTLTREALWAENSFSVSQVPVAKEKPKKRISKRRVLRPKKTKKNHAKKSIRLGAGFMASYQMQFERELQTNPETIYQVSKFTGMSLNPTIVFERWHSKTWGMRLAAQYRSFALKGDATIEDTTIASEFELNQKFLGFFAGATYQPTQWRDFYLWGGAEFALGLDTELKVLSGPAVDTSGLENKSYIIFEAGVSYDRPIGPRWTMSPEVSFGTVITAVPVIVLFEGSLLFKYSI